ncbi:hypothetical protein SCHPADRAFT_432729 [Schizopora paradoxa]|uniref:F-box domain-containing protein n=1 Tax=Schizopora paradoxa TaxID=27342 RepID=A0A0H2RJR8_9AGAM|nr:hypothetical protein SCHPADRAFT_432729 [Schizopora paradoxa]
MAFKGYGSDPGHEILTSSGCDKHAIGTLIEDDEYNLKIQNAMKNRESNSRIYLCRLPDDILADIVVDATFPTYMYGFCIPSSTLWPDRRLADHLYDIALQMDKVEALAHVCHHLRQVILGTSRLWTDICGKTSGNLDGFAQRILSRSGSAELRIRLDDSMAYPKARGMFIPTNISSEMYRIGHLSMENFWVGNSFFLDRLFSAPSDAIKSLEISAKRSNLSSSAPYASGDLFKGHAPNLRRLELRGIATSWTSPIFNSLSTLFLSDIPESRPLTLSSLLDILSRCKWSLEDLTIGNVFSWGSQNNTFNDYRDDNFETLPRLRRFRMYGFESNCKSFVQSIKVSSLERYHMQTLRDRSSWTRVEDFPDEVDAIKETILPIDFSLGHNCSKLSLIVTESSFRVAWWKHEYDAFSDAHHEVAYDSPGGAKMNWARVLRVFRLADNSSITSLTFRGNTMSTEETRILLFLSNFPNLEMMVFTITSNKPVFCNPVVDGLLLLHANEDVTGALPLPRLRTLEFFDTEMDCMSMTMPTHHWEASLEKADSDSDSEMMDIFASLPDGTQTDSCDLSKLRRILEYRNAKGAQGVAVYFKSCDGINEEVVKAYLKEPFVSSLVFDNCCSDCEVEQ